MKETLGWIQPQPDQVDLPVAPVVVRPFEGVAEVGIRLVEKYVSSVSTKSITSTTKM